MAIVYRGLEGLPPAPAPHPPPVLLGVPHNFFPTAMYAGKNGTMIMNFSRNITKVKYICFCLIGDR
jgi:hypothetical protein